MATSDKLTIISIIVNCIAIIVAPIVSVVSRQGEDDLHRPALQHGKRLYLP